MKISKIEISCWRSIVHEKIDFNDLMIFIGQNNHGKSNILSSILFFFGEIGLQDIDFNGENTELWVEVTFSDLNEEEDITFKKYVTSAHTMTVRKQATKTEGFVYHGYIQEPVEDWLKEDRINDFKKRSIAVELPLAEYLPSSGAISKALFLRAQEQYIEANMPDLEFNNTLETTNFLGLKNVAAGSFGDLFFIPSVKSATAELSPKGNSLFAQLYSKVVNKISETDSDFQDAKQNILRFSKILNKHNEDGSVNTQRPDDLTSLETLIDGELDDWNTSVDIQITPPNVDDIFRVGANVVVDDGVKTDIDRKGHGLQRALIFALVKAWANMLKAERIASPSGNREASKATYFIFEEPELFLHPQAQRKLFSLLVELSREENQVLICTHSSSFISLNHHKSICIVKKDSVSNGTKVLQCNDDIFNDNERKNFNLAYWINPERSELFFAKKIILVEGPTDKSIIPMLGIKMDIHKYDYTIIDCGGKDSMPQYIKLLNKFNLSYIVVYDKDHQAHKTTPQKSGSDTASQLIENDIKTGLGSSVIFVNDIEEELGMTSDSGRSKPYKAITFIDDESFIFSTSLKEKIEIIYS